MSWLNYILGFMRVFVVCALTPHSHGAMEMSVTCDHRIPFSILTCYIRRLNLVVARNTNGVVFFCFVFHDNYHYCGNLSLSLYTVNSEIFARNLSSRIALKDIFATLKFMTKACFNYVNTRQSDFVISRGFYYLETSKFLENKTLAKIIEFTVDIMHNCRIKPCRQHSLYTCC